MVGLEKPLELPLEKLKLADLVLFPLVLLTDAPLILALETLVLLPLVELAKDLPLEIWLADTLFLVILLLLEVLLNL